VTITDQAGQQQRTGQTAEQTVASLNRDTATAQTAAQKQDVHAMERTVAAERAIKEEAIKIVTIFTDEAYRSRFLETPKSFKVECPAGVNCVAEPNQLKRTPATPQEVAANASPDTVLAVNGILNDEQRAMELAYQNAEPIINPETGLKDLKPTIIYLMYIKPANNTISELMGVAYERATNSMSYGLANFFGYTNAAETYAGELASRGDKATNSLGHSGGTLVQENSFTILANRPDGNGNTYTNQNLTVRGVGGAADVQNYTEAAAKIINDPEKNKNITYSYFSNDPVSVSTLSGGNPGVWTLKDLWQVFDTNNSMHSSYGTGSDGSTQVEFPVPGGSQGTPDGNAKLIRYEGGERVDSNPAGRTQQEVTK
jgi:filamentous hemagglutinin